MITVVLPSYDEDPGVIRSLVERIRAMGHDALVVSNVPLPEDIPHIVRPGKIGYGNAIKEGLKLVKGPAAYMDADGTYDPGDLASAAERLGECDLVVVRRLKGLITKPEGMTLGSYVRNVAMHLLFFLLYGKWLDTQSGFKVMSDELREIIVRESREGGMTFSLETVLLALKRGMEVCEVQGKYLPRKIGESKLSLLDVWRVFKLAVLSSLSIVRLHPLWNLPR